jgi:signal peptidase I
VELQNVAKRDLAAEIVRQFGEVRLKVTGTSMLPSVWPGDILTVQRRRSNDIQTGEVVLCYRNQGFVAHRLVDRRGAQFITRGDSMPQPDPPFSEDEILGPVIGILRKGRAINPSPNWWYCAASWILRHSDLCTRILLRLKRPLWAS